MKEKKYWNRYLIVGMLLFVGSQFVHSESMASEVWSWDEARRHSVELPAVEFQPHYQSKFVTVKGHKIHYMEAGEGERLPHHQTQYIGPALHFVQEDHPKIIGRTIADWYRRNIANK